VAYTQDVLAILNDFHMLLAKTLYFENHAHPRIAGSSMGLVIDSWLCLRLYNAEFSVPLGAGVSLFCILNIETGDPPAGWGVRRTISNKEFRTAEVFERNKTIFFTSIFCGSLFCGSAVHILKAKSFGHKFFIYNQPRYHERKALEYCKKS